MLELEAFAACGGRLPQVNRRQTGTLESREKVRPEQWLGDQTRPTTASLLCSYQADHLAVIPGFSATRFDDRWRVQKAATTSSCSHVQAVDHFAQGPSPCREAISARNCRSLCYGLS